jgi:hypothetical protein
MNLGVRIALGLLGVAALSVIARAFWVYRKSWTWPTADGVVTRLDVEAIRMGDGRSILATFTYDFPDPSGHRQHGNWTKFLSTEQAAREFAAWELPIGKSVVVRYDPKNPPSNNLELDSWTYTGDRPLDLGL